MIAWLSGNLSTILIGAVLVAVIAGILTSLIQNKKKGKSSCGCECGECAMKNACHNKNE